MDLEKEKNMRVFPVIEDAESAFSELVEKGFTFNLPSDNKLTPPGIGEIVNREELFSLRKSIQELFLYFGKEKSSKAKLTNLDKQVGECIYKQMNITPSIAATLPMWQFLNIVLIPDLLFFRWGANKEHFISARRNYLGTQWWRYYLFNTNPDSLKRYMKTSDKDIADLYERTNSRGLPGHITDISIWFKELNKENTIDNAPILYREVLKIYNAELGYKLYFALSQRERFELFSESYKKAFIKCL